MDGWLGFNGILNTQVASILRNYKSLLVRPMIKDGGARVTTDDERVNL